MFEDASPEMPERRFGPELLAQIAEALQEGEIPLEVIAKAEAISPKKLLALLKDAPAPSRSFIERRKAAAEVPARPRKPAGRPRGGRRPRPAGGEQALIDQAPVDQAPVDPSPETRPGRPARPEGEVRALFSEYMAGRPLEELANRLGVQPSRIRRIFIAAELIEPVGRIERRAPQIIEMHRRYWEEGLTLEETGRLYQITRERVRQLFVLLELPTRGRREAAKLRAALALARARDQARPILWRYLAGRSTQEVARALDLPHAAVEEIIGEEVTDRQKVERRARLHPREADVGSIENTTRALKSAAEKLGRTPTGAEYEELRKQIGADWPAAITIAANHRWSRAIELAGLKSRSGRSPSSRPRIDRVSEERAWWAVREVARRLGHIPSCAEYDRASKGSNELPSLAVVRRRLGGWRNMALTWPGPGAEADPPREAALKEAIASLRRATLIIGQRPERPEYERIEVAYGLLPARLIDQRHGWAAICALAGSEALEGGEVVDGNRDLTRRHAA